MAARKQSSALLHVKGKKSIALPPGLLGYSNLVDPDTYEPDKPKFKANIHYRPAGLDQLKVTVLRECIDRFAPDLAEEAERNNASLGKDEKDKIIKLKPVLGVEEWLEGKLRSPKDGFRIPLPFIILQMPASYKDRKTGEIIAKTVPIWDHDNNLLDITRLRMGMETVIEPIVTPGMFANKVGLWVPQATVRLVGLRVLQLKQFSGASAPSETDEELIKQAMGDDFEVSDDLSAFAVSNAHHLPDPVEDPEGKVKDMF